MNKFEVAVASTSWSSGPIARWTVTDRPNPRESKP